ncbi:MAG: hypothetical protein B7Z53_04855, partial [Rhodospirillales bacterium 12-71-4]
GAHLVETAEDVFASLPAQPLDLPLFNLRERRDLPAEPLPEAESPSESTAQLLELIGTTPVAVDDLVRRCHLSAPSVQALLLDLELSGLVETLPGNRVVRSSG